MTNKPDISPYRYFEDMEEGVEYIGFYGSVYLPERGFFYSRDGGTLNVRHNLDEALCKSLLQPHQFVFIPRYTPPKPANSWDEYMNSNGMFRLTDNYYFADSVIQAFAKYPKAHAAFNDLIESKRNKDG